MIPRSGLNEREPSLSRGMASPGLHVRLVYCQWPSSTPDSSIDPLIAVVREDDVARGLKSRIESAVADSQVTWEEFTVQGVLADPADSAPTVHIVVQGWPESTMPDNPAEMEGPVGVSVHASHEAAVDEADRLNREARTQDHAVLTHLVGYRRDGWPFTTSSPP